MWTFKSKFAAWVLRLAEGVGAAPTLPVLETGAFAAMLSLNIFTRQFNKVESKTPWLSLIKICWNCLREIILTSLYFVNILY